MMEFLANYGLFLAKAVTLLIFIWLLLSLLISLAHKPQHQDNIEIKNLNRKFDQLKLLIQKS